MQEATDGLIQSIEDIWDNFLEMDIEMVSHDSYEIPESSEFYTSVIEFSGGWTGALAIRCTKKFAGAIAAAMSGLDPEELGPEEVMDSMCELANVAAGNLIPSLNIEGIKFSLPQVLEGLDYNPKLSFDNPEIISDLAFATEGDIFLAQLVKPTG